MPSALAEQTFAAAVRADESQARAYGIQGVPFFVVDGAHGVSGAQPADVLVRVLDEAWTAGHRLTMVTSDGTGEVCGPDGC